MTAWVFLPQQDRNSSSLSLLCAGTRVPTSSGHDTPAHILRYISCRNLRPTPTFLSPSAAQILCQPTPGKKKKKSLQPRCQLSLPEHIQYKQLISPEELELTWSTS